MTTSVIQYTTSAQEIIERAKNGCTVKPTSYSMRCIVPVSGTLYATRSALCLRLRPPLSYPAPGRQAWAVSISVGHVSGLVWPTLTPYRSRPRQHDGSCH